MSRLYNEATLNISVQFFTNDFLLSRETIKISMEVAKNSFKFIVMVIKVGINKYILFFTVISFFICCFPYRLNCYTLVFYWIFCTLYFAVYIYLRDFVIKRSCFILLSYTIHLIGCYI